MANRRKTLVNVDATLKNYTHGIYSKSIDGNWLDIFLATSIASHHHLRHHSHRRPSCPQHYANEDPSRCPSLPYIFSLSPRFTFTWPGPLLVGHTHTQKSTLLQLSKCLCPIFSSMSSFVSLLFMRLSGYFSTVFVVEGWNCCQDAQTELVDQSGQSGKERQWRCECRTVVVMLAVAEAEDRKTITSPWQCVVVAIVTVRCGWMSMVVEEKI